MVVRIAYKRDGVSYRSDVLQWGAFPLPVPRGGGLVRAGSQSPEIAIVISAYAIVAECRGGGVFVPVVVPIDENVTLAGEYMSPEPGTV